MSDFMSDKSNFDWDNFIEHQFENAWKHREKISEPDINLRIERFHKTNVIDAFEGLSEFVRKNYEHISIESIKYTFIYDVHCIDIFYREIENELAKL